MAKKLTRKEKGEQINRRFEIIKSMMSSFIVGTAAIVVAVIFIPKSPIATIIKTHTLIDTVSYQINVTDEDNALDLSTLVIVLENQFEYYEQPISLGESSGYFYNLKQDTDYWLNIYGSKGYGQERLDSAIVKTRNHTGGFILNVETIQSDFETTYTVDVLINDPEGEYQSVNLYYGYHVEWEPDMPISYTSIPITSNSEQIELHDVVTNEAFHIYLEAVTNDGTETLDDIWVIPPFETHSSMYLSRINDNAIYVMLYRDMNESLNSRYHINAYIGDILISRVDVDIGDDIYEMEVGIAGLATNKTYRIEGVVTYINPQTLREESTVIYEEEVTTLASYELSIEILPTDGYIEVTITASDPNHYFQIPYYELYEVTDDHDMWLSEQTFMFTQNGDLKTSNFTIAIPINITYRLVIGVRNETDYTIKHILYDEIYE